MDSTITNYWQLLWRIPVFIVLWIAFLLLKYPTVLVGFFVVPFLYRHRKTLYKDLPAWTRPWANPEDWWGGPEGTENSLPAWWLKKTYVPLQHKWRTVANWILAKLDKPLLEVPTKAYGTTRWSFYKYHAIRNPANGLRTYEFLDLDIVPEKVEYIAYPTLKHYDPWYTRRYTPDVDFYCYLTWQGLQSCFKLIYHWNDEKHIEFKIGWRVNPGDRKGFMDPDGTRKDGAGFATKFLPWRKG